MKIADLVLGMEVLGDNSFNCTYFVTKINKTTCWLEHRTGEKVMRGGKWYDEVFLYRNIKPSILRKI